jgi:hypothetical protein
MKSLKTLRKLWTVLHDSTLLPIQIEKTDDLDRVLNIFARVNMGGTKLKYAELLVGTATTQWKNLNAHAAIDDLRLNLNTRGEGFKFGPERIMKAGLVLTDVPDPRFHATTFTKSVSEKIEANWSDIANALQVAVEVLVNFGISDRTLQAENVLLPIAYYIKHRKLTLAYAAAGHQAADRDRIHAFVARTLLKQGFWTGAVDPIIKWSRDAIKKRPTTASFPLNELEVTLATKAKKSITFTPDEIDQLMKTSYHHTRSLLILRLLYPEVRPRQPAQPLLKDHVFPRRLFSEAHFRSHGVPLYELDTWGVLFERLPNLQLLDPADSLSKAAKLPAKWLADIPPNHRSKYRSQDLAYLPATLAEFGGFYDARRVEMTQGLSKLLGVKIP